MFCFKCGASMPDDSKTCPQCATPVQNAPVPPPAAQPASDFLNPPQAQPQYPQSQPYPQQAQYYAQQPPTDGKATASLVLGILSILCFGILTGIPAIILGHIARGSIQRSMGRLSGSGMALAGLIMGYVSIVISLFFISALMIPNLLRARIAANEAVAMSTVRTINISQTTYKTTYPDKGFAPDLATLGPGPSGSCTEANAEHACLLDNVLANSRCAAGAWCDKGGYRFSLNTEGTCPEKTVSLQQGQEDSATECNFVVVASPIATSTGSRNFCSTSDAIVRYRYGSPLSEPVSVQECSGWSPI